MSARRFPFEPGAVVVYRCSRWARLGRWIRALLGRAGR